MFTRNPGTGSQEDYKLPPRRHWRRWAILGAVVALVAAGLVGIGFYRYATCWPLVFRISRMYGECVGVTDGSFVFDPALADVETKIKNENHTVEEEATTTSGGKAVTIGLLDMYTANNTSPLSIDLERKELEGAYTAQLRANETSDFHNSQPKIRLVLANEGSHELAWPRVTQQLEGMTKGTWPLVAVAGLGVSIQPTLDAAHELAWHQIPMVGGVITSDVIADAGISGLVRVQPDDRQFVNSLINYLQQHDLAHQHSVIVYDNNAGTKERPGTDLYSLSLLTDLENGPQGIKNPERGYTGDVVQGGVPPDQFSNTVTDICSGQANVVFYAGWINDLPPFLNELEKRSCVNQPLTVATAGTDLSLLNNPNTVAQLNAAHLTIVYASATDVAGWELNSGSAPSHFAEFQSEFTGRAQEPSDDMSDGYALALHDAVATAVIAARLAYTAGDPNGGGQVTNDIVLRQLNNLVGVDVVPGAAGNIAFPLPNNGAPSNKPVPVLTIPPTPGAPVPSAACSPPIPNTMYCTP